MQPVCIKCGQQHVSTIGGTACTSHKKDGSPCRKVAMQGQDICAHHGGKAAQNKRAAANRILEREVVAQMARMDGVPIENPLTELAALGGRARAWMDLLESRVQKLLAADDASGGDPNGDGIRYRGGAGEQLRAEVALYERAMDRVGKFLADYGRLNIDERLSRIEETKARVIIEAVEVALAAAGVRGQPAIEGKRAAARHLRSAS